MKIKQIDSGFDSIVEEMQGSSVKIIMLIIMPEACNFIKEET